LHEKHDALARDGSKMCGLMRWRWREAKSAFALLAVSTPVLLAAF